MPEPLIDNTNSLINKAIVAEQKGAENRQLNEALKTAIIATESRKNTQVALSNLDHNDGLPHVKPFVDVIEEPPVEKYPKVDPFVDMEEAEATATAELAKMTREKQG